MTLKELRKKANLTQIELSKKIGVSGVAVNYYENGKRKLPIDKVSALAQALNVSELQILQCFQQGGKK